VVHRCCTDSVSRTYLIRCLRNFKFSGRGQREGALFKECGVDYILSFVWIDYERQYFMSQSSYLKD